MLRLLAAHLAHAPERNPQWGWAKGAPEAPPPHTAPAAPAKQKVLVTAGHFRSLTPAQPRASSRCYFSLTASEQSRLSIICPRGNTIQAFSNTAAKEKKGLEVLRSFSSEESRREWEQAVSQS